MSIDSIIHWAHWIDWNAVGLAALVFWGALMVAVELWLLDCGLERKIKGR
jgi:hypothetical protein